MFYRFALRDEPERCLSINIVKRKTALVAAQRDHGVNARGALRWNVTGEQGDEQEHSGDGGEGGWVAGFDAEQLAANQPG